jgi:hypothetical protein
MRVLLLSLWITLPALCDAPLDLTGTWRLDFGKYTFDVREDQGPDTAQPWAASLKAQRRDNYLRDRWTLTCLPGGPAFGLDRQIAKIVHTPGLIVVLYEDLSYRQIFLESPGAKRPADSGSSFMGFSTGYWEGDTLVVTSSGFKDRTWLDYGGTPHTEALQIEERYRRTANGSIDIELTYRDPGAYKDSWTIHMTMTRLPGVELIEYVCGENEKDRQHFTGKLTDSFPVPVETLAGYAGTYRLPGGIKAQVRLEDDHLVLFYLSVNFALVPKSVTSFASSPGPSILFVTDETGRAARFILKSIELELVAEREP